jgi:SAM-dependent methyltransferase
VKVFVAGLSSGALERQRIFRTLRSSPEFVEQQGLRLYPAVRLRLYGAVVADYLLRAGRRALPRDDEAWLAAAYSVLLGREIDAAGTQLFLGRLQQGEMSPFAVLDSICDSSEFKRRHNLPIRPLDALHQARMLLIQSRLPAADAILDLGGAAHNEPRGALLMLGYPYVPQSITIIDLPPDARIGGAAAAESAQELTTPEGTRVRYFYRSMADLDFLPDGSVELIVSGESIEHIAEAEAELVCDHAWRLLRPGGSFCLDTPNARLTRLQSPEQFIHPEHQKEYRPDEIRAMLERRGFAIADAAAICPMPVSLRSGRFDPAEMTRNIGLSGCPDEGYLFFFRAVKPATP